MRKRTVKNLCKEIFWHIVYFLPIVIALFSMLIFSTDSYAEGVVSNVSTVITKDNVTDLTDTRWYLNERLVFDDIQYYYEDAYNIEFDSFNDTFDVFVIGYDLDANGGNQVLYNRTDVSSEMAYNSNDSDPWATQEYRSIYIRGGDGVTNIALIEFLRANGTMEEIVTVTTVNINNTMLDCLDSSFNVMGMTFENDILYNALNQVFVNGGILAVFTQYSILLKFACYYFYVHVIHLFIDALLFIPKLAHKWIDSLTRCE